MGRMFKINLMNIWLFIFLISFSSVRSQSYIRAGNYNIDTKQHNVVFGSIVPPSIGIRVKKIAFGQASGKCSDEVVNSLISDFTTNGVKVIDSEDFQSILSEQDLSVSEYVDKKSAITLGKIIGPSILIYVKVLRCSSASRQVYANEKKYDYKTRSAYIAIAYYSKTRADLSVSIKAVDLMTGSIIAAKILKYSPEESNKSYQGYPEAPSAVDVQEIAFKKLINDVDKMFFPWIIHFNFLYHHSGKKYRLGEAFNAVKKPEDIDNALALAKKNLETYTKSSKTKDKILSAFNNNIGILYLMKREYDTSIEYFQKASDLWPGSLATKAINQCELAKGNMLKMQQINKKDSLETVNNHVKYINATHKEEANTLTNTDIIHLTQKNLPSSLIIEKIKTSNCKFNTSTDSLIKLTKAHVNNDVIIEMMHKK